MLCHLLSAVVVFELATFSAGANPEFCKTLSECIVQGEQYFKQYSSLVDQQRKVANPPKTPYETCMVEYTDLTIELNSLTSQKNQYLAECVESRADQNVVNNSSLSKFTASMNSYIKSIENQTSPTETVRLTSCKCEQSAQISTYSKLCNTKRTMCNSLTSTCSSQYSWCTSKYQKEQNETIARQTALQQTIILKQAACNALNAPAITVQPTTKTSARVIARRRRNTENVENVDQEELTVNEPVELLVPVIDQQAVIFGNDRQENIEEPAIFNSEPQVVENQPIEN